MEQLAAHNKDAFAQAGKKSRFASKKGKGKPIKLGLALQGGGAYGAFTYGVMQALLESDFYRNNNIEIQIISGASAGAVNGALLSSGLNKAGLSRDDKADLAIANMQKFWEEIGRNGSTISLMNTFSRASFWGNTWPNLSPMIMGSMKALPNGYIPSQLKSQLNRHIPNWEDIQTGKTKLHVNAVRKKNPGKSFKTDNLEHEIFSGDDLSADAITASGSLKEMGPHKLNGHEYYDGAYLRNPAFKPFEDKGLTDVLVIALHHTPDEHIIPATQEQLLESWDMKPHDGLMTEHVYYHMEYLRQNAKYNVHAIGLNPDKRWDKSSRMNIDPKWLKKLHDLGYQAGQDWIRNNGDLLLSRAKDKTTQPLHALD